MKKQFCAILAVLLAALMLCGCYPLRIAKNPNQGDIVADASQQPGETEPDMTEPEEIEDTPLPTDDVSGSEEATEAPTEAATEPVDDTEEPTERPTEAVTEKPTEAAGTATPKPTEAAGTPTPKPTEAAGTANATATPKTTPTPTPKPTPTPTPKPTATPTPKPTTAPTATPTAAPSSDFADFSSQTINGYGTYSNSMFGNAPMTMVNFWATWCGPCIEELPILQQLNAAYGSNLQVVTVLYDSQSDGAVDTALGIMSSLNFTLPVIRCNSSVKKAFSAHDSLSALPVTFFVDRNGHLVRKVSGGHTYNEWCSIINGL